MKNSALFRATGRYPQPTEKKMNRSFTHGLLIVLMLKVVCSSETSVYFNESTRRYISQRALIFILAAVKISNLISEISSLKCIWRLNYITKVFVLCSSTVCFETLKNHKTLNGRYVSKVGSSFAFR
jgi:hypothetical protein